MPDAFETTKWSRVLAARGLAQPDARAALAQLFEAYWPPLYAFARRRGLTDDDAHDLLQGFFTRLLETDGLRGVRREKGRFRAFLLGAFKHYLANVRDHARAAKRGGGAPVISLDVARAESAYREPRDALTPEQVYEHRWALTLLDRALTEVCRETAAAGKTELFERLKPFLTSSGERPAYRPVAAELGMSEGGVRVAVHRLRQRFGAALRAEIAATVPHSQDIDEELRFLLEILERRH